MRRIMFLTAIACLTGLNQAQGQCQPLIKKQPIMPLKLAFDSSMNKTQIDATIWAANQIQVQTSMKLYDFTDQNSTNKIYYLNKWGSRDKNFQANTNFGFMGDFITRVKIEFNGDRISFFYGKSAFNGQVSFESIAIHELMHTLGAPHNQRPTSVMQEFMRENSLRYNLDSADIDLIRCNYQR